MRLPFRKILMMARMTLAGIQCANAENLQGVVYLKNGGVIRGDILERPRHCLQCLGDVKKN